MGDVKGAGLARLKDAAEFLSISVPTLYRWIEEGKVESRKIGGCRRIPWSVLHKLAGTNGEQAGSVSR